MPLRKSPTMTPARLAANRASAAKSTGPRTQAGKDRVRWNALKRGLHARSFREALIGMGENPRWFDYLREWLDYGPEDAEEEKLIESLTIDYWWAFIGSCSEEEKEVFRKTNPESLLESVRVSAGSAVSRQHAENSRLIGKRNPESRQVIENKSC